MLYRKGSVSMIFHTIEPVCDANSKILILGSFPSVASREEGFFYGHPQNRFWRVLSAVLGEPIPSSIEEKRGLLLSHGVALWDVIASCEIEGSADSTVKAVTPNDLSKILEKAKICAIFLNGKTAEKYYNKYISGKIGIDAVTLPSTSPANAKYTLEKLTREWSIITKYKG